MDGAIVVGFIGGSEGAEVISEEIAIEGPTLLPDTEGRSGVNREAVRARG